MNFLEEYYNTCQEELIRYGVRFDHTVETAEDLFTECHRILCEKNPEISETEYRKRMKGYMKNKFIDHFRRNIWLEKNPYPGSITPKPLMSLEEHVCRSEEVELLMLALARLSGNDREILLEEKTGERITRFQRYQAKKRLQVRVLEVIASQKHPPERPLCPYCHTFSLYFMLDKLAWVCEACGQVTKVLGIQQEKKHSMKGNK